VEPFAPHAALLSRRRLFGLASLALIPAGNTPPAPAAGSPNGETRPIGLTTPPVPSLADDDPLARLAVHYGRLLERVASVDDQADELLDAGETAAADELLDAEYYPAVTALTRAERALRDAMRDRGRPVVIAGGRWFANTCHPGPFPRELPQWVYCWRVNLAGDRPAPADDTPPNWLVTADQLVGSTGDEGPGCLTLEFELIGDEADAARAWLKRNTLSVAEALAADARGDAL